MIKLKKVRGNEPTGGVGLSLTYSSVKIFTILHATLCMYVYPVLLHGIYVL